MRKNISSFSDFLRFIRADLKSRGQNISFLGFVRDPISRFHWYLRFYEYLGNYKIVLPVTFLVKFVFLSKSRQLGFSIPKNTLGKGVYIPHWGTIVVNSKSFVGENTVLNVGVVLGRHPGSKEFAPQVGERVYLGPGVKIYGKTIIGNESIIGANSVVGSNVPKRSLVTGIPGVVIKTLTDQEFEKYGI